MIRLRRVLTNSPEIGFDYPSVSRTGAAALATANWSACLRFSDLRKELEGALNVGIRKSNRRVRLNKMFQELPIGSVATIIQNDELFNLRVLPQKRANFVRARWIQTDIIKCLGMKEVLH